MDSPTQLTGVNKPSGTARERAAPAAPDAVLSALVQTATLEFISSMQLLAERARFLSGADGVSVALKQDGSFVYCVSVGSTTETAISADVHKAPIANCLASAKSSMVATNTSRGQLVRAAVPIMRQGEVAGFFELSAPRSSFSNEDLLAVSGLAEMVNTALDHKQAAENARKQMLDFFGDLAGAGDRLGDFGPQNLAEASAQTVDGHLHRPFTRSQPGRYLSVGSRLVFPCQKRFK